MKPRRLCLSPHHKGPRWLLAIYFYPKQREIPFSPLDKHDQGAVISVQARCITCQRIEARVRRGYNRNPNVPPRFFLSEEQKRERRNKQRQASYHRRMQDPEYKKRRQAQQREYQRERLAAKRREQGIPVRGRRVPARDPNTGLPLDTKHPSNPAFNQRTYLPSAPLLDHLDQYLPHYRELLPDNLNKRVRESRKSGQIELNILDSVLITLDSPHLLAQLYPDSP